MFALLAQCQIGQSKSNTFPNECHIFYPSISEIIRKFRIDSIRFDSWNRLRLQIAVLSRIYGRQSPTTSLVCILVAKLTIALTCSELQDTAFTADRTTKSQVLLSAKEAVSLWVLGARKVGVHPTD